MATIPTVSGDVLILDDEDVPRLQGRRIYSLRTRRLTYACFPEKNAEGKQRTILVHRFLLETPRGVQIDHVNGNGLDNRRANLRLANHAQQQANRRSESQGTSRYRGVTRLDNPERWMARVQPARRSILVGVFDAEEMAARAFDHAALAHWGEFARLNFPGEPLLSAEQIDGARSKIFAGRSRFRGVAWDTRTKSWSVKYFAHGRTTWVGRFPSEETAARAHDAAVYAALGEAARSRLNFPDEHRPT